VKSYSCIEIGKPFETKTWGIADGKDINLFEIHLERRGENLF
jgi:hypothetical protein